MKSSPHPISSRELQQQQQATSIDNALERQLRARPAMLPHHIRLAVYCWALLGHPRLKILIGVGLGSRCLLERWESDPVP